MIELKLKNAKEAEAKIAAKSDKNQTRAFGAVQVFTKGLFVGSNIEFVPDEFASAVDGFIVYKGLWRTDWSLVDADITIDNIDLFSIPELARCDSAYSPGTPSNWDDWESGYDDFEPFSLWSADKALCDQLFRCETECFCCDSGQALGIVCNKNIILVDYIGFYPERLRTPDEPVETPTTEASMKCVSYGADNHDEPDIEATAGDTTWCKDGTVTENRNEIAMNVLMEGEDLYDAEGNFILKCDNGWHLNLNSQKCADTECCNCDAYPPAIEASSSFIPLGGSADFSLIDAEVYDAACDFEWTITGPGSFVEGSSVKTIEGKNPVTFYAPATNAEGCSSSIKITCEPSGKSDTAEIKFIEDYGDLQCLVVESPPITGCAPTLCVGRIRTYNCLGTLLQDTTGGLFNTRAGYCGAGAIINCWSTEDCSSHTTCARNLCTSVCCYDGSDL